MPLPQASLRRAWSRCAALLLALAVLLALAPSTAQAAVPVTDPPLRRVLDGAPLKALKPRPVQLKRRDLPVPLRRPAKAGEKPPSYNATAADGSEVSVVPAPGPGPVRSTWDVRYTGFDAYPAAKAAFASAVDTWSRIVASPIPIKVNAVFALLPQDVLGSAAASQVYRLPDGSAEGSSWYVSALADALEGYNISAQSSDFSPYDIDAEFTSDPAAGFYFGTDGLPPAGMVDFRTVVLHELGHGLGFAGSMTINSSNKGERWAPPVTFDRFAYDAVTSGSPLTARPNPGTALGNELRSNDLFWAGSRAVQANGSVRPRLFAPTTWQEGSSFSHLDEATYARGHGQSLMTPEVSEQEVIHSPGSVAVGMLADQGWNAVLPPPTVPTAPASVKAVDGNSTARVSWAASTANGSPISGYTVTSNPAGGTCSTTGALSCTVGGLLNGTSYTFTVTAKNGVGDSPASAPSNAVTPHVDDTLPTSAFATSAPAFTRAAGSIAFTGSDPGRPGAALTYQCSRDGGAWAACSSPWSFSGLSAGQHNVRVRAADEAGNVQDPPAQHGFLVDTSAPTVATVAPTASASLSTRVGIRYSGSDTGGAGLAGYEVGYRSAALGGGFGSWSPAIKTTSTSYTIAASKGRTYCFSVRSRDRAGNASPWSSQRCTAIALDDPSLSKTTGWTRYSSTSTAFYAKTYTTAARTGVTLSRSSVAAKRLSLVAVKCSTCGTVGVYWKGVLIKKISLYRSTTAHKQIIPIATFTGVQTSTVHIRTLNSRRTHIDGIIASKV